MANRITTVVEFVTDRATSSVKKFRQDIAGAEGAFGKFKAGASAAMATVSANAGLLAVSAGGALVAFGAKAVQASQEVALGAGKLADATGLTVEAASRLREVSADLGISGETVTAVVKKMSVEIGKGNPLLEQYGIALQHTSDGAADINATLLDTIERIGAIEDPTKRAAAAQAAFGRGYAEAAELIFTNADELKRKLDDVSDAKVVTPEELAKARAFRDSMEELRDVGEDLATNFGQLLVPALTEVATELKDISEIAGEAKSALDKIPGLPGWLKSLKNLNPLGQQVIFFKKVGDSVEFLTDKWDGATPVSDRFADSVLAGGTAAESAAPEVAALGGAIETTGEAAGDAADELVDLGDKAANSGPKIGDMAGALDDAREHLADLNEEARDNALGILAEAAKGVADALDEAFGGLEDDLSSLDLLDDIKDQFDNIAEAAKEANDPKGVRDLNREVRKLQGQLLDYLQTVEDIPPDKVTEIIAQIRTGDIDTLKATLDELTKDRFINITPVMATHDAFHSVNASFTPGSAPSAPTFQGVTAAPNQPVSTDARTIINYYPVGTTPTTQYQNDQIDLRRNGPR